MDASGARNGRGVLVLPSLGLVVLGLSPAFGQGHLITTAAGGGPSLPVPATKVSFQCPAATASDAAGNLFIADNCENMVFRVDVASNRLTVVAGNGASGYGGDGGPATAAELQAPFGVAVDSQGNVFIADQLNQRIRRVDGTTGVITTVAGNGTRGYGGDNGDPTAANLFNPMDVAVDNLGNLYIADTSNQRIRFVSGGVITTVAGNGVSSIVGDCANNADATSVSLNNPFGVAVAQGNLYIADFGNSCVREVSGGAITTVAGTGTAGFNGDGIPATTAELNLPFGVALDASGNLYISDFGNNRTRRVDGVTQQIATVAGTGAKGFGGDNHPATSAQLADPKGVALDAAGNLYIADEANGRVRRVDAVKQIITTVAGDSSTTGDGGPASTATLVIPKGVAVDSHGNIFIADTQNARVRRVDAVTGTITTVAGNGSPGFIGDGGLATEAGLDHPTGVAIDSLGNFFIADSNNNRIRFVNATTKLIGTVAGTGTAGFNGDGLATATELSSPTGVALDSGGTVYIADSGNQRIRILAAGNITTVAGNGTPGFNLDGIPATTAELNFPFGVVPDGSGGFFVADTVNARVRQVDSAGNITTVAGNGTPGFTGDGTATGVEINNPSGVIPDGSGGFFIADTLNQRVRQVDSGGNLTTIAGNGTAAFAGDGGLATSASLATPTGVALDAFGNLLVADSQNNRIRKVVTTQVTLSIDDVTVTRGTGGANAIFTVSMNQPLPIATTVDFATSDGTADAGVDYTPVSGQLTFPKGIKSASIQVPVLGTTFATPPRTFNVSIYGFEPGSITKAVGVGTINTSVTSGQLGFSSSTYSVLETAGSVTITVTRTGTAAGVSVDYATSGGTAQSPANYTPASGTLQFGLGVTSQTFVVFVRHDTDATGPLTVGLVLSNPQGFGATLGQSSAVLTINDADKAGTLQFSAPTYLVQEASTNTIATINVTRLGGLASNVTVNYAVTGGTATLGTDYGPPSGTGTLIFGAGVPVQTFTIPILTEKTAELSKTVNLTLSLPGGGGALGAVSTAVLTIGENDPFIQFSALTYTASETQGLAAITVTRSGGLTSAVSIDYATFDGSATAPANYLPAVGTLHFGVGVPSLQFYVHLVHDTAVTGPLTVLLTLSNPQSQPPGLPIVLGQTSGVLTINDIDKGGTLQFSAAAYSAKEPSTGTTNATITVTRTGGTASNVTVNYAVAPGGTGVEGTDYGSPSGTTLTFGAGVTSQTFTIPILANGTTPEVAKTVNLALSPPTGGGALGKVSTAVLTIAESDPVLQFSAANYTVSELTPLATITVTRSVLATGTDTVHYQTLAGGTAVAGTNYQDVSDTLTFTPGVLSRTFTIPILRDKDHTGPLTVNLGLDTPGPPPAKAVLGNPSTATLTITDVDVAGALQFSASTYSVLETAGTATITVMRTGGAASNVTVNYTTTDGTAIAGTDYTATSGTLIFGAGATSNTFTIPIADEGGNSGVSKTVNLALSQPSLGATLGTRSSAVVTIAEPDPVVQLSAATYAVSELNTLAPITVTRSGSLSAAITVQFQTQHGSATPGLNYKDVPLKTLTFAPGVASQIVYVPILHDTDVTGPLTVLVTLLNLQGPGLLGLNSAVLTINDVDKGGTLQFSASAYSTTEPSTGSTNATITVTRTGGAASNVKVNYAATNGTGQLGVDYGSPSGTGTLTFKAGLMSQTFTIPIFGAGTTPEFSKTVNLTLSSPTGGGALGKVSTAVLTILESDPVLQFSAVNYTFSELTPTATITVLRSVSSAGTATVNYQTQAGSAVVGKNYVSDVSGVLTFTPGVVSRSFTIKLLHDTDHTGPVTIDLSLSGPTNAVLGTHSTATVTITDVDVAGSLQFNVANFAVQEPVSPSVNTATITVTRTGGTASNVTVNYAVSGGTAVLGTDYGSPSGTMLTFGAGVTSQTFTIPILDDGGGSGFKTITLLLSAPSLGATLGAQSSTVLWIVDK
jgi:hypothetical protein